MLKIVIDTNTLISALGWKEGNPRKIIELCIKGKCLLITSPELINEFYSVINRPKFNFISKEEKNQFLVNFLTISCLVEPKNKIDVIKEYPMDNIVLEAAFKSKADYIISGDEHILRLRGFKGTKIVNSKSFLDLI